MNEQRQTNPTKKSMPHLITPDTLLDIITKIALGKQSADNRLSSWYDALEMLNLGVGVKSSSFDMFFNLICSVESETTRLLRVVSFKVAYRLMLKNDHAMKEAVIKNLSPLFRNLLFGMMDTTIELRVISEMCLFRLLSNILTPEEAFCAVMHHFGKTTDINKPDICKLFSWVWDRFQPSIFTKDLKHLFLDSFETQLERNEGFRQKKLLNLLNLILSKSDANFQSACQMILVKVTYAKQQPNKQGKSDVKKKKEKKSSLKPEITV